MLRSALFAVRSKLEFPLLWFLPVCLASSGLWLFSPPTVEAVVIYEGFGAVGWSPSCDGGAGQPPTFLVNSLADTGTGTLRDALSQGNRTIIFNVSGTITLTSEIKVKGPSINICGLSAPAPDGITLVNYGLYLSGTKNVHHILIQGLRIRNAGTDAITVRDSAHHVVIDHVSAQMSADGDIDVTRGASDVTVQWSILAQNVPTHNLLALLDFQALRVTFHHNLFVKGQSRQPHTGWDGTLATAPPPATPTTSPEVSGTVADIINNLIWKFSDYGTLAINNAQTNVVKNFYLSLTQTAPDRALRVNNGGKVYADGNYFLTSTSTTPPGVDINFKIPPGQSQFPAAPVTTTDPCPAAQQIVAQAGARTPLLDDIDKEYIRSINEDTPKLPTFCPPPP